jgi:hypothetical protein
MRDRLFRVGTLREEGLRREMKGLINLSSDQDRILLAARFWRLVRRSMRFGRRSGANVRRTARNAGANRTFTRSLQGAESKKCDRR